MTAIVTVGEKLATMVVSSETSATRAMPVASGSIGSHGHASQIAGEQHRVHERERSRAPRRSIAPSRGRRRP